MVKCRFLRFLLVGGLNTLFSYSVFALFLYINWHYSLAILLATGCGVIFNFKTIGTLVFQNQDNSLIFKFLGVYTLVYLLNVCALKIFVLLEVDLYLAAALLILPMATMSYFLNRKYVFKSTQGEL